MTTLGATPAEAPVAGVVRRPLAGVLLALLLAAMDSTVVGTILPVMRRDLSSSDLYPWLLSGFLLTAVLAAASTGRMSNKWDDRTTLLASIGFFVVGSLVVGLAGSMAVAVTGRLLQGAGAGAVTAAAYTYVGRIAEGAQRARLQGVLSAVWGLAAVVGPVVGGLCTGAVSWRLAFFINLPLAAVAVALLAVAGPRRAIIEERRSRGAPVAHWPVVATVFSAVSLSGILLLVQANAVHLPAAAIILVAVLVLGSVVAQVVAGRKGVAGLIPLALVSAATPRRAGLSTAAATACLYAAVTLLPLDLASGGSKRVYASSLLVASAAFGWVLGSALTSAAYHRLDHRSLAVLGSLSLAAGAALLALPSPHGSVAAFLPGQVLIGLGTGLITATALLEVQEGSQSSQLGALTSTISLLRNVGAAIGVNSLTALASGLSGTTAHALRICFLLLAVLGLLTLAGRPVKRAQRRLPPTP